MASIFGNIFVASQLQDAVVKTLQDFFPTYLREMERVMGMEVGYLVTPENYTTRNSFDSEAGEELPKIVVISPGMTGRPKKTGGGMYTATYVLGVGVAFAASTEYEADLVTKTYAAAIKAILMHQTNLDGTVKIIDVQYVDEQFEDLPVPNRSELFKGAGEFFTYEISDIITKSIGPDAPVAGSAPPPDYGLVQDVIIETDKLPIP